MMMKIVTTDISNISSSIISIQNIFDICDIDQADFAHSSNLLIIFAHMQIADMLDIRQCLSLCRTLNLMGD